MALCSRLWTMMMMLLLLIFFLQHTSFCLGWNYAAQRSSLGFVASSRWRQRAAASSLTRLFDVPYDDGYSGSGSSGRKKIQNHMDIVRSLQESFYNSATLAATPQATFRGDTIENLPLWRVSWQEVPGRSNILHVHEGMYTNMFEQILHQPAHTWYIGHLYVPPSSQQGGSRNLKSLKNPKHQLRAWNDPISSSTSIDDDDQSEESSAAVLGTLLRIADYRRLVDGRLILLVQAMERFVVTRVQQHVPYGMATVQLLPDLEEVDDDYDAASASASDAPSKVEDAGWVHQRTEWDVAPARALALQESFQKWHRYEYENTLLPLPLTPHLEESDLVASALVTVLPFAPYSSTINVTRLAAESIDDYTSLNDDDDASTFATDIQDETTSLMTAATGPTTPTLEQRLMNMGILLNETTTSSSSKPLSWIIDPNILKMSCNELEFRLWWALNDFLKMTRTPVSPILLGLLPPLSTTWDVYMDQYGSVDDIVIMKNDDDTNIDNNNNNKSPYSKKSPSFVLHRIAHAIQEQTQLHHKYVAVDESYPALRRQKRLSYAAAYLLENPLLLNNFNHPEAVTALRQVLLQIPSTRQRLALVYQMLQTECWGAFQ